VQVCKVGTIVSRRGGVDICRCDRGGCVGV